MLDHHKTAAESLAGVTATNLEVTLDMGRSGATIARDHFAPPGLSDTQQARVRHAKLRSRARSRCQQQP